MSKKDFKLYGGKDPHELPAYQIQEAAHYIRIPQSTLRSWVLGRYYPIEAGRKFFKPIITLPEKTPPLLSFMNLVEVHVLDAIRRVHHIPLPKVRTALGYLKRRFPCKHPSAEREFGTDGLDLFIQKHGQLMNISRSGQLAMRELIQSHLLRNRRLW